LFGWSAGIVSVFGSMAASLWTDAVRPMHMDVGGSLISQQATFLLIGAAIVLSVELIRRMIVHFSRLDTQGETSSGVIFSLEQGQAWASWPGHPLPVRLGPQREVETMMEDFLAQSQVAQRLALSGSAKLPLG